MFLVWKTVWSLFIVFFSQMTAIILLPLRFQQEDPKRNITELCDFSYMAHVCQVTVDFDTWYSLWDKHVQITTPASHVELNELQLAIEWQRIPNWKKNHLVRYFRQPDGSFSPGMLWMVMARIRRRMRRQLLPVCPTPSCCLFPVSCPSELFEWVPLLLWYTSPFSILSA